MGPLSQRREIAEFKNIIDEMELVDIPLSGRTYTWYRPNGQAQSRIGRFLLSRGWLQTWSNCAQLALDRDISDHCTLLLRCVILDWGPKSIRVLNCWL